MARVRDLLRCVRGPYFNAIFLSVLTRAVFACWCGHALRNKCRVSYEKDSFLAPQAGSDLKIVPPLKEHGHCVALELKPHSLRMKNFIEPELAFLLLPAGNKRSKCCADSDKTNQCSQTHPCKVQ